MQAKTTKKISRSAVATVLATSSVALGLPAEQTNAAQYFKDVKTTDFFYLAVNELAENKIVNGYGDGTFRPLNNVTRGEAAKMLALALKLDVANAETKQFKDVKKGDIFYKYIAALANKGIINGYPDGSFKPNEVVQRGAMAKMVALGYEFTLAKNFTHPFKDVDQKHIFNQHIQTLVNLNITKGTSFNTFSPGKAVTRGELATFISRASKANAGKPIYVVDNIIGNKIYINSVGYTIGANVASYIKVENKSALIGAHVEGTFNGMTLTNVTKLTLNATGNTNSIYTFDGGNSTYNGTLVVNGSYLKFKNWTLNGQTIVSETPRKSLAQYNRLSELKIASLASGFIDFTKPTNPDDGNLNNGSNSGSLNSGTSGTGTPPYAPYNEKLAQIHKYVDFTNVTVRSLFVEQNRTYIAAQKEIAMVTVRRDVEFVELNFNMRNLYIEGDESLTIYGTHDIATVYKNSYYSVFFNTNSNVNTLIVDNSNGWIDLGDYVEIDKVIIPPKTTPNDIFDDYKNDNDKIGNIEDNTGGEVDRDPIENGIVPDVESPDLTLLSLVPNSEYADLSIQVNEPGILHYLVLPENEPEPSIRQIVNSARNNEKGAGFKKIEDAYFVSEGNYVYPFRINELVPETKYKVYLVYADNEDNFSGKVSKEFATVDGTSPYFIEYRAEGMKGGRRIKLDVKPSEKAMLYYYITEGNNVGDYDTKFIIDNAIGFKYLDEEEVLNGTTVLIERDHLKQVLKPQTPYVVYGVLVDDSGNPIDKVKTATVTTDVLDETPPFVVGPNNSQSLTLEQAGSDRLNEFYMYFSEKLDEKTAEDINNYILSGTGIINVPGQKAITPTEVTYSDYGTGGRVLIKIPSMTGFIHGDTLRVTVTEKVLDLAANPIENVNNIPNGATPRNYAEYRHRDESSPDLTINSVVRDAGNTRAEITYTTDKAGTIYYMIIPSSYNLTTLGITSKDFVDEFTSNKSGKFDINNPTQNNKLYLEAKSSEGLKDPFTTELGQFNFLYIYKPLNPLPFESYKIYMVEKDRSGNLSQIASSVLIADEEAPVISGIDFKSLKNEDLTKADVEDGKATISISSVNEGGRVYYQYLPKYVEDVATKTFVLNDKIFYPDGTRRIFGTDKATSAENKADFLAALPGYKDKLLQEGTANNNFEVTDLKTHTEYVLYMGVEDTFGNFTVYMNEQTATGNVKKPMIKEMYADSTPPKITDSYMYRNPDDTFTLTFSEVVGRNYKNILFKNTEGVPLSLSDLDQESIMVKNSNLKDILKIETDSKVDVSENFIVEEFAPIGAPYNRGTKLKIKAISPFNINQNLKVTLNIEDQIINDKGNKADSSNTAIYKVPEAGTSNNIDFAMLYKEGNYDGSLVSPKLLVRAYLNVNTLPEWGQKYYYVVMTSNEETLDAIKVSQLIQAANIPSKSDIGFPGVRDFGMAKISDTSSTSFDLILDANIRNTNPNTINTYRNNERLFLFTLDNYGNIVWAKDPNGKNYSLISPYNSSVISQTP